MILYPRSNYFYNNMFIIYIFLNYFDFINCFGLSSIKIAETFAITFCHVIFMSYDMMLRYHVSVSGSMLEIYFT